jgi:hypothetical protein
MTFCSATFRFEKSLGVRGIESKVISIRRNKFEDTNEKAPSTHSLLRLRNQCRTSRNGGKRHAFPKEIEESLEELPEDTPNFEDEAMTTRHSDEWRSDYTEDKLEIIELYNDLLVPRGWLPVNKFSEALRTALERVGEGLTIDDFEEMFDAAANEREVGDSNYSNRRENKLLRILWANL